MRLKYGTPDPLRAKLFYPRRKPQNRPLSNLNSILALCAARNDAGIKKIHTVHRYTPAKSSLLLPQDQG